ncbi:MAG: hypothetical protein P8X63_02360 [Desulfuromonadaceae bacterium]
MDCPKCGHENPENREDCLCCGVIFAKIKTLPDFQDLPPDWEPDPTAAMVSAKSNILLGQGPENSLVVWGRALILLGIVIWSGKLMFASIASNTSGESLLHLVNLPFHEAGHMLFRPLGRFFTSLGGTLAQLLVPLICGGTLLLKTRDAFGAAVCIWWFGENFLDIAPYINDARAGVLPLLGGNTGSNSPYGFHDWEYLLTETGLLRHDHLLAQLAHGFGSLLMIAALLWAGFVVYRQFRETRA